MTTRTTFSSLASILLTAAVCLALAGCCAHEAAPSTLLPIPNARVPMEDVLSGGQPTPEQIEIAARVGFRTVINLRPESEPGFEWERGAVEELGMHYVLIAVAGGEDLTRENVEIIDAALERARQAGPVLLHCSSGNRVGAILGLRAAWLQGVDAAKALEYGLGLGAIRLEDTMRKLLGLETIQ